MAFTLTATSGSTTIDLNGGSPFRTESIQGLAGLGVARHQQRGPLQDGVTNLGYRLQPRNVTLNLIFTAASDAALDGYRDSLMAVFRPLSAYTIRLEVERDDGAARYLNCQTVGEIVIALAPELRPGHTHRATIELRAAYPAFSETTETLHAGTLTHDNWWLANGTINPSDLLEYVENPAAGQQWNWSGTAGGGFSVVVRGVFTDPGPGSKTLWSHGGTGIYWDDTNSIYRSAPNGGSISAGYPSGTATLFYSINYPGVAIYVDDVSTVRGVDSISTDAWVSTSGYWGTVLAGGTATQWPNQILRAAVYDRAFSTNTTRASLHYTMSNINLPITLTATNGGDLEAFPRIVLNGPIANPVITNQTTGGVIDLTGITIGSGLSYTLDLRGGNKTLVDSFGNNVLGSVTSLPIGIANWSLTPGVNSIHLKADSAGTPTILIYHTNEYTSF